MLDGLLGDCSHMKRGNRKSLDAGVLVVGGVKALMPLF